jgi:hypothetical protein
MALIVRHSNSGFFSCCSVILYNINKYIHEFRKLPVDVNSSDVFYLYKIDKTKDITYDFFIHSNSTPPISLNDINNIILYKHQYNLDVQQFTEYGSYNYNFTTSLINKYFTPTQYINNIANNLISKYNIDVNNCIVIYYRGTDKYQETAIDSFDSFYNKLSELLEIINNNNITILIQSDTAQFVDYIKSKSIINPVIIFNEMETSYTNKGIHYEHTSEQNYKDISYLFASVLIMSKCKYILCSSGNVSMWIMLYRGNAMNVHQNLNLKWINNNLIKPHINTNLIKPHINTNLIKPPISKKMSFY